MIPIYSPIKNIYMDFGLIESEIDSIPIEYFYDQTVWRKNPEVIESIDGYLVGSEEDNKNSDYFTIDKNGINHVHHGKKRNWKGLRLTEVKGEPYSLTQNTIKKNDKWIRFRKEYPVWSLREELYQYLPYTFEQIKKLPLLNLNVVRVLVLQPGDFGPIHIDEGSKDFYKNNFTCINLNIRNGNQPLKLFANDKVIEIDDKIYQINNGYPHGVETVTDKRITITVEGSYNENLMEYLDLSGALFA